MITKNILKEFNTKGFVIIRNVIKKKEIINLMNDLEKVKKKVLKKHNFFFHKTSDNKFNTIHAIQKFHKRGEIINLTHNKKINHICEEILKDKIKVRNIEFFLKPRKTGMPSPFHQDNYYWNILNAEALNVWIACSNASKNNGGLCYLEGSHKLGVIEHELSNMKGSSQKISENILKKLNFKKIFPKLKPGDCLIHHPETIHGSFKNTSKNDRLGFVISYAKKNHKVDLNRLKSYMAKVNKSLKKIYN